MALHTWGWESPPEAAHECHRCGKGLWKVDEGRSWDWHYRNGKPASRTLPTVAMCSDCTERTEGSALNQALPGDLLDDNMEQENGTV